MVAASRLNDDTPPTPESDATGADTPPWRLDDPLDPPASAPPEVNARAGEPEPFMANRTLLTAHGFRFGELPVPGLLGDLQSFDDLQARLQPWIEGVKAVTDHRPVTLAAHMIYALANPCETAADACLTYLDAWGVKVIDDYIKPALERDIAIVLDVQIGRAGPVALMRRVIDAGCLAYPNVHVAFDPEFATAPNHWLPGDPIGSLPASLINQAQELLSRYMRDINLKASKVLILHQFIDATTNTWSMLNDKNNIETYPGVEIVINTDRLDTPYAKVYEYNNLTDQNVYPKRWLRGIKIFQFNTRAPRFSDIPVMTPRQIFGLDPTASGRRMWAGPHVLVIA